MKPLLSDNLCKLRSQTALCTFFLHHSVYHIIYLYHNKWQFLPRLSYSQWGVVFCHLSL